MPYVVAKMWENWFCPKNIRVDHTIKAEGMH
jgi:hypothetical protein